MATDENREDSKPRSCLKPQIACCSEALRQKHESRKELVTQYQPSVPNLKNVLMEKWHLIQNQPSLRQIFKEPPLISYKRGKSLKDILVRAKL